MTKLLVIKGNTEDSLNLISNKELDYSILNEFSSINHIPNNQYYVYELPLLLYNAYILKMLHNSNNFDLKFESEYLQSTVFLYANNVPTPTVSLSGNYIKISVPSIPSYQKLMTILNANAHGLQAYTIPMSRLYESYRYLTTWNHSFLPKFTYTDDFKKKVVNKLTDENTLKDLFQIELSDLFTIKHGYQVNPEGFDRLKYNTAVDLLFHRPTRYLNRTNYYTFNQVPYGEKVFVKGKIVSFSTNFDRHAFLVLDDGIREVELVFWKQGFLTRIYKPNDIVYVEVSRKGRTGFNGYSITPIEEVNALPVAPVYRQAPKYKITTKLLTNSVEELLTRFNGSELANYISLKENNTFWKLLEKLHFPKNSEELDDTLNQLAFIELVFMQLLFLNKKYNNKKPLGIPKNTQQLNYFTQYINSLPYKLTSSQDYAIKSIINKLRTNQAEDLLLSGDTGSGKSTVAIASCLYTIDCGYQTVLLAPTEILANQLYDGFMKAIDKFSERPNVAFLSGSTKQSEKNKILSMVKNGEVDVLVGTHAVTNIDYHNLGLVVIDEEQKFGRNVKYSLLSNRTDGKQPDILKQTATPIPQSTALAFYGDVDLITLKEKPSGRKENITKWIKQKSDDFLTELTNFTWLHIFDEIQNGRQVFIVTPAVLESAKSASVEKTKEILEDKFPDLKIDTIHGKHTKEQQTKKITKFRDNKTQVLIASSIIEVGIDIPNATIILVLDADRFGASSLHQIRGRVGRSDLQGYCYLIAEGNSENSQKRLQSLVDSNDGFDIALVDLETRREGDLFGEKQSGESTLKFCDFINHSTLIELAQLEAKKIYDSPYQKQAILDAKIFLQTEE